jgi:hypothetical protein
MWKQEDGRRLGRECNCVCVKVYTTVKSKPTSVADPDPGSGAFLTPGSGVGKKSGSGSAIRDEQNGSYFLELRNHFSGLKYLNSLMRIRDQDPG